MRTSSILAVLVLVPVLALLPPVLAGAEDPSSEQGPSSDPGDFDRVAGAGGAAQSSAEYTPPPEPGDIYTVIDFARFRGTAEATTIEETLGGRRRNLTVVPHHYCTQATPAGVVVRFRHYAADAGAFTITTTGRIVRRPEQGSLPLEAMHRCYDLVS